MCFGAQKQQAAATPAPAPAPPDPTAEETSPTDARKEEDLQNYGTGGQSLRVDRSTTSGGVGADGTGLRM